MLGDPEEEKGHSVGWLGTSRRSRDAGMGAAPFQSIEFVGGKY